MCSASVGVATWRDFLSGGVRGKKVPPAGLQFWCEICGQPRCPFDIERLGWRDIRSLEVQKALTPSVSSPKQKSRKELEIKRKSSTVEQWLIW